MFSSRIIERRREQVEKSLGHPLKDHSPSLIRELSGYLDAILDENGKPKRDLTREENAFIENEVFYSSIDFHHWAENYAFMQVSGGGLGRFKPWESQRMVLRECARIEEEQWERHSRGMTVDGIRIMIHKARQLGLTQVSRQIMVHSMIFNRHIGGMSASIDDDKVQELYDRDMLIYDNLPWWMRPEISFNVKGEHIHFSKLNTRMLYQQASQKSGLGQGRQFLKAHLTECAAWPKPLMIELDFFPTLPPSLNTICLLESTAYGRGNWWHEYTESVRVGEHPGWSYLFIPWYIERTRYRATPPTNWKPNEVVLRHARLVESTSPRWTGGKTFILDEEQLYFYELSYESARRANTLNIFLTNYPAVPEEGFQHSTQSAFSTELIAKLELDVRPPDVREIIFQ